MKTVICLLVLALVAIPDVAQTPANPVTAAARSALQRQENNVVQAAQEMPADKYGYQPTPAQMTFGQLMAHVAQSNHFLCSKIAGGATAAPQVSPSDPKGKLTGALKASFDFCSQSLAKINDSTLGEEILLFGGRKGTRAAALFALTSDWADHYATAAMYLRLNGLLPPTAKARE